MSDTFIVGVNYWPAQTAMLWWQRFDPAVLERDFARLKEARLDYVRFFLLWEEFQPEPARVSRHALGRLIVVADVAHSVGLRLMPTFFTGHMSGVNWLPTWMLTSETSADRFPVFSGGKLGHRRIRNYYQERTLWEAQKQLIGAVVQALAGHPALWAWDLGNESSNYVVPPDRLTAQQWLWEMVEQIKRYDSRHPVTLGLHMEDLQEDRHLGPAEAATACDFLCMHGYPVYAPWADGPTDAALLPFLGLLTRWLGGKEVLFEEFGIPTEPTIGPPLSEAERVKLAGVPLVSEEAAMQFYQQAVALLHRYGMIGALAWCYSDYDPTLWTEPPCQQNVHERFFGLFRYNGSAKPAVSVLREFAEATPERSEPDLSWIDLEPEHYYEQPAQHLVRLYRRFKQRLDRAT
ncbi:MAG: hypothetical protein NZ823_06990 [Blastocatellia bacterium]|nr:hypothetical protein [Blastocatellia bacterium]